MNRVYELGFIIPSSVNENDTQNVIDSVQQIVENLDGQVVKVDYWGRRRLAYPIQDYREGFYVFMHIEHPTGNLGELERVLLLNDQVIRHIVVRIEEDDSEGDEQDE